MLLRTSNEWFEPVLIDAMFFRSIAMRCTPAACMVAIAMITNLDSDGLTRLNVSEIATFCGCDKGTVSRVLPELALLNFCEAVPMKGGSLRFRVSRVFAERIGGGKKKEMVVFPEELKLPESKPVVKNQAKGARNVKRIKKP